MSDWKRIEHGTAMATVFSATFCRIMAEHFPEVGAARYLLKLEFDDGQPDCDMVIFDADRLREVLASVRPISVDCIAHPNDSQQQLTADAHPDLH